MKYDAYVLYKFVGKKYLDLDQAQAALTYRQKVKTLTFRNGEDHILSHHPGFLY